MRILSTTGALVALVLQSAVAAHTQSAASALDTLLPKASELCDKAPALKPQDGLASGPAVVLFRSREGSPWGLNYQITPLANPADVRVVLCITERVVTSSRRYTDGSAGYDRTWSIAVMKWPDGSLIAHQSRTGRCCTSRPAPARESAKPRLRSFQAFSIIRRFVGGGASRRST